MPDSSRKPVVSRDEDRNWANNDIQFPRLIAELEAAGAFTPNVVDQLCIEMDLTSDELFELVDRAQTIWDDIKAQV